MRGGVGTPTGPDPHRRPRGSYRVISADYEGHRMATRRTDTLTPDELDADLLAIADAAGAGTFA